MENEDIFREIEVECFRYFRRQQTRRDPPTWVGARGINLYRSRERVGVSDRAYGLLWAAFEALSELGAPEFWTPVEVEGEIVLLIVFDGTATLTTFAHDNAATRHVGPLEGGIYTERFFYERQALVFKGEFSHDRLASPLTIASTGPDEHALALKKVRDRFRQWARANDARGPAVRRRRSTAAPVFRELAGLDSKQQPSG
jgi:hypothetical protein